MSRSPHLAFCRHAALAAAAFGTALWLWPAASGLLPSGTLPPLHARCVGVMHLALAAGLWSVRRRVDKAAARIPLLLGRTWAGAAWLATLLDGRRFAGLRWLAATAALAGGAAWLCLRDGFEAVPAQHPDRAWLALALGSGTLAAGLLLAPAWTAAQWPWRMNIAQAAAYGSPLLGGGVMMAERFMALFPDIFEPAVHQRSRDGLRPDPLNPREVGPSGAAEAVNFLFRIGDLMCVLLEQENHTRGFWVSREFTALHAAALGELAQKRQLLAARGPARHRPQPVTRLL